MIQSSGGLSDKEIEAMVKDAERNQAADAKRKESVEARNELERFDSSHTYIHTCIERDLLNCACISSSLIHIVTKNLAEHGEKLDDETKKTVQDAIDSAKAVDSAASVETLKVGRSLLTVHESNTARS